MNGYICTYIHGNKSQRVEVYAATTYAAQQQAAKQLGVKPKDHYRINVTLAEKDGQPVVHTATE